MDHTAKSLLVTDLDNTLWDWFGAWHASFSAMLDALVEASGVDQGLLENEIRRIHQARGTSEYSHLLNEVPLLVTSAAPDEPMKAYDHALHRLYSERKKHTKLYDGVLNALETLKARGVKVVAYTESFAFFTEWRIKHTGLDGIIDVLYSPPDHEFPKGVTPKDLRKLGEDHYGLKHTTHHYVGRGVVKPSPGVLSSILEDMGASPAQAVYVGDSLMKDVVMAQAVGVLDVHAKYGESHSRSEYDLLRRVSHWPDKDVAREETLHHSGEVVPTIAISDFSEILDIEAFQVD